MDPLTGSPQASSGAAHLARASGWRRLALVLGVAWFAIVAALAVVELATHHVGLFVEMSLPTGTVVNGSQATLPDGRVIALDTVIERRAVGPWQIDWQQGGKVTETHVRGALLAAVLAIPLAVWLLLEAVGLALVWIGQGFGLRSCAPRQASLPTRTNAH